MIMTAVEVQAFILSMESRLGGALSFSELANFYEIETTVVAVVFILREGQQSPLNLTLFRNVVV